VVGGHHGPIDQCSVTDALGDVAVFTLSHDVTPSRTSELELPGLSQTLTWQRRRVI
jgi:hypothetical protein